MTGSRLAPARALGQGLWSLARAPHLIAAATVLLLAIALPFAVALDGQLHTALSVQPPINRDETDIDPEWWHAFRQQSRGLAATFTPAVIGVAAPLDTIDALLNGRRPPLVVIAAVLVSMVAWSLWWGGLLRRLAEGRAIGPAEFLRAGVRLAPRFLAIALAAAAAAICIYAVGHRVLAAPIMTMLAPPDAPALRGFVIRLALDAMVLAPVAVIALLADYARVAIAAGAATSAAEGVRAAARFIRANGRDVAVLCVIGLAVFAVMTAAYLAIEVSGALPADRWLAIAAGQAYVVLRVTLRLSLAAAEQRIFAAGATP